MIRWCSSFAPGLLGTRRRTRVYNSIVSAILFVTVLFANFAESVAEGAESAGRQPEKKKKDTQARRLDETEAKGWCRPAN